MKPFNNITVSSEEPTNNADVWIKHCKNMFKTLPNTTTVNGITFTNNKDGTITASGTATAVAYIVLGTFTFDDNSYALSGCPENGGNDKYSIYITNTSDWSQIAQDLGEGDIFNNVNGKTGEVRLRIANGYTCNNLIFKPQLEIGEKTEFTAYFDDDILIKEGQDYKSVNESMSFFKLDYLMGGADANNFEGIANTGAYAINVDANNKNFPSNGGTLLVFFGTVSWGFQLFVPYDTNNNRLYIRNKFGNSWSSWKEL